MRVRRLMADSKDIIHNFFIFLKGCSRSYVTDENVKKVCITHEKFSFRLMVPSHAYGKLNQPVRGSERQEILFLPS